MRDWTDDDDSDGDEDEDPTANCNLCWSCQREFSDGEGISVDESGIEQVCESCWQMVPVTSRLVLGLLFRRIQTGGIGLHELIEDALRTWPFSQRPSGWDRPSRQ